ncbi:HAAS signaling domain-containing protein [Oryzobacter terrae]|uniref:HAAS signaling domain-containing protein n=1 Tax=Oryzobacter terrae TaxID=1620385 RepID=UPI0036720A85
MNSSDTRISSYLDTLARLTTDLDPSTRDDVIAGVREHLDATLAEHPDDPGAVDAALLRLGPPERVAAAARSDAPPPVATAWSAPPAPSQAPTPGLARVGAVVVALSVLVPTLAMAADRGQTVVAPDRMGMFVFLPFFLLLGMSTPWLAGVVCVLLARGLTPATRLGLTLLGPLAGVVVLAGAFWMEPRTVSAVVSAVAAVPVAVATLVLAARAWREVGR